jgi:dephospho-CoA kinase
LIVGLAGKSCSGKDTLAAFFTERGFLSIDADAIGHRALEANRDALLARFGTMDRSAIGRIVFSDPRALADLEGLTHPWIGSEIRRLVREAGENVVINAALLHKQEIFRLCDVVVWVQAPLLTRILRARTRDRLPWSRILARIWAQRKLGAQVFPPDVDILKVDNRGSPLAARRMLEARFGRIPAFPKKEDTYEKQ